MSRTTICESERTGFQRQAKRQKALCLDCYDYTPHIHEDRLKKIPSNDTLFVCGNGDISFCPPDFTRRIIACIAQQNATKPQRTYYLQSKRTKYFEQFTQELPANVILLTTLETNRDEGYELISKAPVPSLRYTHFLALNYSHKVVTIEPLLDFDMDVFTQWIVSIEPEYVWIGFDSKKCGLPEPSVEKLDTLITELQAAGIEVRGKKMEKG